MKPEDVTAALDALQRSESDRAASLHLSMEQHSDRADRVIAQLAQLKLVNTELPSSILQALQGVAASENPL